MDYPTLFNLSYYLLFRENKDAAVWGKLVARTCEITDVLPLIYYMPFKASYFYLKSVFPDQDFEKFAGKCWYAEQYFNVLMTEDNYHSDRSYEDFFVFLQAVCFVYPTPFVAINDLFMLHYVFHDMKIAINFHTKNFSKRDDEKASQKKKLA